MDGFNVCWDTQHAGTDAKMAENASKNIKMCQVRPRRPNSPCRIEIETAKRPEQWKHISNEGNDGYALQITPIENLGTRIRKIVFGRSLEILGSLEDVEANVEGERDGGKDEECDSDVDGTVSGGNDDPNRVEAARLAAKSQQMRNNAKKHNETTYQCRPGNLPILKHLAMESLGRTVNAEQSNSNLEMSVKHAKSKLPTLDALTQCGRCGGLETESDGQEILMPSARVRGSADEKLKTMGEEQTR